MAKFVEPVKDKISSGLSTIKSRNKDIAENKSTCVQSICIAVAVLNIIAQAFAIILCCVIVREGSAAFAEWMYPWHQWSRNTADILTFDDLTRNIERVKENHDIETMTAVILAFIGPYIMMSASFVSLAMSVVVIHGVAKKSASTVKAFIIYSGVVLPLYLIVNIFYLAMIWVHQITEHRLIAPHFAVLIMNIIFSAELLLACKAHTQLNNSNQFTASRLQEF